MNMRQYIMLLLAILALIPGYASTKVWQQWSADEQKRYFGLSCVADDSALAVYRSLIRPEQDEWCRFFWAQPHDGINQDEHTRRTDHAWREFDTTRCFKDERARVYVRYGEPVVRLRSQNSKQLAGGAITRQRLWEVWQYPDCGLYFNFIEFDEDYRIWATIRLNRRHPVAFFRTGTTALPLAQAQPVGRLKQKSLDLGWARFKSQLAPGKVRWELYWRIPVEAVRGKPVTAAFTLTDASGKRSTDTIRYEVAVPADSLQEPYAYGQRNLDLDPGHYRMEIAVRAGGAVYRSQTQAELVAYRPGIQECSDVELAVLQDTTFIATNFQKGIFTRVIPHVIDKIPARQPYFVYYEAYNLRTDEKGNHQVRICLQVFQDGRRTLSERAFATGEFTYKEPGSEFHGCHCVYPQDLGPGKTYLKITVEDLLSGRVTTLIKAFRLKEL